MMHKSKLYIYIILFFTLFAFTVSTFVTFAQPQEEGIIVSPPYILQDVESGAVVNTQIKVINQIGRASNFKITTRKVEIDEEGNFIVPEGNEQNSISDFEKNGWITFGKA